MFEYAESVPTYMACEVKGPYCNVDFNVPIIDDIDAKFTEVYKMFEEIIIINSKIEKLYDDCRDIMIYIRMFEEYDRIYKIHESKVYPSFEEIAGTWSYVTEKLNEYYSELNEKYTIPKNKLHEELQTASKRLCETTENYGWRIEYEFSISQEDMPKYKVTG